MRGGERGDGEGEEVAIGDGGIAGRDERVGKRERRGGEREGERGGERGREGEGE